MAKLPKVLIVEDNRSLQDEFADKLHGRANVLAAVTIQVARCLFAANPDIKVIVCARVPGKKVNTVMLVREFRKTFTGPMIAMSRDPFYVDWLVATGCDHSVRKTDSLPLKISELLKI